MASRREYVEFVLGQLAGAGEVTCRPMMGEYILYYRGKVIGGVYDDRLMLKPCPAARELLPAAETAEPYPGASPLLVVDAVEDAALLQRVALAMHPELPEPKKKTRMKPLTIIAFALLSTAALTCCKSFSKPKPVLWSESACLTESENILNTKIKTATSCSLRFKSRAGVRDVELSPEDQATVLRILKVVRVVEHVREGVPAEPSGWQSYLVLKGPGGTYELGQEQFATQFGYGSDFVSTTPQVFLLSQTSYSKLWAHTVQPYLEGVKAQ